MCMKLSSRSSVCSRRAENIMVRGIRSKSFWIVATSVIAPCSVRAQEASPFFPPFGIDLAARDTATRPADDFYQYQNGSWLARTPIPSDLPEISTARQQVRRVETRVRQLIKAAAVGVAVQP